MSEQPTADVGIAGQVPYVVPMTVHSPPTEAPEEQATASRWASGLAGAIAAGVSLAVSELFAGLFTALPSLVSGVATFVIDNVPPFVKELAIDLFGTNDKLALGIGIVVVSLALGSWIGDKAAADRTIAVVVFGAFGLAGALAAGRTPQVDVLPALANGAIAAIAGYVSLGFLLGLRDRPGDAGRRSFLVASGSLAALAVLSVVVGRNLAEATRKTLAGRSDVTLPEPRDPAVALTDSMSLEVDGISPLVTPNADFYRIDTVPFSVPRVDLATWSMKVTGMVDGEVELTFEDLLAMDQVERYITISCVSNEVGGGLVGNAKWLGVPLSTVLERAGVAPGAEQIVGRSVDGFTVGFPVEAAFDGRDALVAIGMNDEPLPMEHGFPARLVVSGLYGYVSATKWLSEIELTTWDAFDAYWIPRGWAKEAPIKTQSRIDSPRRGTIDAGPRAISGVAWAPNIGISRVEVRIDGGEWLEADLAEPIGKDSWRQWTLPWNPDPGSYTLAVRATDANGVTQTSEVARPAPDGATGYHRISVTVA